MIVLPISLDGLTSMLTFNSDLFLRWACFYVCLIYPLLFRFDCGTGGHNRGGAVSDEMAVGKPEADRVRGAE
jgi:hypothetical protein